MPSYCFSDRHADFLFSHFILKDKTKNWDICSGKLELRECFASGLQTLNSDAHSAQRGVTVLCLANRSKSLPSEQSLSAHPNWPPVSKTGGKKCLVHQSWQILIIETACSDSSGRSELLWNGYEPYWVQIIASLHHYFSPSWILSELSKLPK